jgi:hypothetical protein
MSKTYFTTPKTNSQWVNELAKTVSHQYLPNILMNTIRDIARNFMLTEKEKMHRTRIITEAYDAWLHEERQGA